MLEGNYMSALYRLDTGLLQNGLVMGLQRTKQPLGIPYIPMEL